MSSLYLERSSDLEVAKTSFDRSSLVEVGIDSELRKVFDGVYDEFTALKMKIAQGGHFYESEQHLLSKSDSDLARYCLDKLFPDTPDTAITPMSEQEFKKKKRFIPGLVADSYNGFFDIASVLSDSSNLINLSLKSIQDQFKSDLDTLGLSDEVKEELYDLLAQRANTKYGDFSDQFKSLLGDKYGQFDVMYSRYRDLVGNQELAVHSLFGESGDRSLIDVKFSGNSLEPLVYWPNSSFDSRDLGKLTPEALALASVLKKKLGTKGLNSLYPLLDKEPLVEDSEGFYYPRGRKAEYRDAFRVLSDKYDAEFKVGDLRGNINDGLGDVVSL